MNGSLESVFSKSKMMHTINHPDIELIDSIAEKLLHDTSLEYNTFSASDYMLDPFKDSAIFPVYPAIAEQLSQSGSYIFKANKALAAKTGELMFDLQSFVEASFKLYEQIGPERLTGPRFTESYVKNTYELFNSHLANANKHSEHPYKAKEAYSFWKRSIPNIPIENIDPVVKAPVTLQASDKIATAGSCFAQHIAKRLANSGFNYFVTETPPKEMSELDIKNENYGVFSARYGNIYTTKQLLQLFDRAFGYFKPTLKAWLRSDGQYVDPFRPQISFDAYTDIETLLIDQRHHLDAVRTMFENTDVFIFTLGLTEAWEHIEDGAVIPLAPGVVAGDFDKSQYRFVNYTSTQVSSALKDFVAKLKRVNPTARVLLTVSPVPLMATYEDRHVLVSNTYSKSVLRASAEEVCRELDDVSYFPSYEIITGSFNKGAYFKEDLREVTPEGVDHVMKLFLKHCTDTTVDDNAESK
ncbi:GSCFA domain-containing protein [Pseudoalteromonas sp. YIC-656]|uniref:GSCFA domain-containing protein n=1 Tax=Pseudoalteromonas pernae TaxID=3118054 RepID=UPI003242324D